MSRDMKPRAQSAKPKRKGGIFVGIFIGLLMGALVAAGFAWYIAKMPLPFQNHGRPEEAAKGEAPKPAVAENKAAAKAPVQPIALPGKPGDKVDDKPRFEFYKILPGKEATDEPAKAGDKPAEKAKPAEAAKPAGEPSYLQAGAFSKPEDADTLKARLALMGVEASVQPVAIPDKGTLYRVRLGPFAKPEDVAAVRSQLAQAGIPVSVVKAKE